jgi:hypothetical protein
MQAAAVLDRAVKPVGTGDEDEADCEPAEIKQEKMRGGLKEVRNYRIGRNLCRQNDVESQGKNCRDEYGEQIERGPDETGDRRPTKKAKRS